MISIIIPIYNDEKYISICLDSVLSQTYTDFEILCMDDGSSDNTISILKEYINKDKRIRLFQNEHKGPGWERNFGIENSNGEYITFMDHDDFVNPMWLEKMFKTLTENKVDVAYCCNCDFFEEENRTVNYSFPEEFTTPLFFNIKTIPEKLVCEWFAPWRRLVKKEILIKNNIRFAVGKFKFDDVLFTEELLQNVNSAAFCNEVLYTHRIFKESITGNGMINKDVFFEHFDTVEELIKYCKQNQKDEKLILIKMFNFLSHYLFYVSSSNKFYKKFKKIVYKNHFPLKLKLKLKKHYLSLLKRKALNILKK